MTAGPSGPVSTTAGTWASDRTHPPDGRTWDLLVVGGGTAGIVAAKTAAAFGVSVLLVEESATGGDCLWTGCVPSKALLAAAHAVADARSAVRYGVHAVGVDVDFGEVMRHVRRAVHAVAPEDSPAALRRAGVRVAHAHARFVAPDAVDLHHTGPGTPAGPTRVTFRSALVATGSAPAVPPVPGLAQAEPLTSDDVWELDRLPVRLLVLGGGSIGCELGQAFARLGSRVTLVEAAGTLLPGEEPDAAGLVHRALVADGVEVHTGAGVEELWTVDEQTDHSGRRWRARLGSGVEVDVDRVLVAVGRTPGTDGLGLADAAVDVDDRGHVCVDGTLRSSNRRIWSAGDVTGHPQFTHLAGVHGSLAATNAVLGLRRRVDHEVVPRVTFTQPEVAAFGVSVQHARSVPGLEVHTIDHRAVDRAVAEDRDDGSASLVVDRRGRVVGASLVGPRAGEALPELVLAARRRLRARDLAGTIHAYPTYADGTWQAALADTRERLSRPMARRVTRLLVAWRRRRLQTGRRSSPAGHDAASTAPPRPRA